MSDARQGRFEIDLDEIERQLRRSAEAAPAPKSDPLAELARIVGQDDPFSGLFAAKSGPDRTGQAGRPAATNRAELAETQPDLEVYRREEEAVLHAPAAAAFDPVADAYGAPENAIDEEDFRPLEPRRSRRGLIATLLSLVLLVGAGAGVLAWRNGGVRLAASNGVPPVIKADNAPLKVAPENPGGIEIPNQDRQIYERGTPEGKARVVDRQEQPVDVREAARSLPPAPTSSLPPSSGSSQTGAPGDAASSRAARASAVQTALGEPRRVRTVTVRPDGTLTSGPSLAVSEPAATLVPPATSLPPPVPVATVPITLSGSPPASAQANSPAASTPAGTAGGGTTPATAPVPVLPPQRPRFTARGDSTSDIRAGAPTGGAGSVVADEAAPAAVPAGRAFTVQLGVRASEQEARSAFTAAAGKYGQELSGRSPVIAKTEVAGKTVYRVRVAAASRDDATSLCQKLKTAGAQCFVAGP